MIKFCPRFLVLPLLALAVIVAIANPGQGDARHASSCGPALAAVRDPDLRASFARFDRQQSTAARQICAIYHDIGAR
jgi:hypothetical protein